MLSQNFSTAVLLTSVADQAIGDGNKGRQQVVPQLVTLPNATVNVAFILDRFHRLAK
jgi:hypothetical protein